MSLVFRTPASVYHYEPSLLGRLQEIVAALEGIREISDVPFGWDLSAIELVQFGEEAVLVVPLKKEGEHVADLPLIRLPEGWLDTCCFPLLGSHQVGVC
jgi:hypothetical protein